MGVSAEEALQRVQSEQRVFVQGGAATPHTLIRGLLSHASRLKNVELIHLHTEGEIGYSDEAYRSSFRIASLFVGSNLRKKMDYDRVDYLPCFLSEVPQLFRSRKRPIDVALIHVSPPDSHGLCSLGVSVDIAKAAVESASTIIAQVNPHMPRVHGDGILAFDEIDCFVDCEDILPERVDALPNEAEIKIGRHVASLVEEGATLQVGVGTLPNAVLSALSGHRHLGVHTETWSDGMRALIESGVVDNSKKRVHPGRSVSSFIIGSRATYDFIHDNTSVIQLDAGYVNSPEVISRNPKVVAINSAVEVDLTGQVCADSIGHAIISGVGGQMDFIRGASLSEGGKPIIAITARTKKGKSRLVSQLIPGAGVVTTRAHVHYVVTEYGIADLYGKTLSERAKSLILLAHPDDRESLEREWRNLHR